MPASLAERLQVRERWFTLKPGVAAVVDYTALHQDANSLSQVGKQDDRWQVRDLQLILGGTLGNDYKLSCFVAGSYKFLSSNPRR